MMLCAIVPLLRNANRADGAVSTRWQARRITVHGDPENRGRQDCRDVGGMGQRLNSHPAGASARPTVVIHRALSDGIADSARGPRQRAHPGVRGRCRV